MRFLLSLMAIAMFAVSVGCDKPADKPADAGTETPAASSTEPAATGDSADTQKVSLKLPGMT